MLSEKKMLNPIAPQSLQEIIHQSLSPFVSAASTVDCGVARDKGTCTAAENAPLVDMMQQTGVVRGRCAYECTPAPVPASVLSLVPLAAINSTVNSTLHGLKHNKAVWNAVRLQRQPFVVAGDVMLSTDEDAQRVIVTRIYDIGQSALQMGERSA